MTLETPSLPHVPEITAQLSTAWKTFAGEGDGSNREQWGKLHRTDE